MKNFLPVSALTQWAAAIDENSFPDRLKQSHQGEQLQIHRDADNLPRTGAVSQPFGATEFQDATTLTLSDDPKLCRCFRLSAPARNAFNYAPRARA